MLFYFKIINVNNCRLIPHQNTQTQTPGIKKEKPQGTQGTYRECFYAVEDKNIVHIIM